MIDSHAHYSHKRFEQAFRYLRYTDGEYEITEGGREEIFENMKQSGINAFVEPAIDIDSNYILLDLYEQNKGFMYPAVGVHPTRTFLTKWKRRKELEKLVLREGVIAVGETGLDYHYARKDQHRLIQKMWFSYQLSLADKAGLPLILHIREADKDALKILKRNRKKIRDAVVHCYCKGADIAKEYLDLGFYFGIGGALLCGDESAAALNEAVKEIPIDRILLETDAPYVLPDCTDAEGNKPSRKVRNTSTVIIAAAEKIARIKGVTAAEVEAAAEENTRRLFHI